MRRLFLASGLLASSALVLHCSSDSATNTGRSGTDAGPDGALGEGGSAGSGSGGKGSGGKGSGGAAGSGGAGGGAGAPADAETGGSATRDAASDSASAHDAGEPTETGAGGIDAGGTGSGGVGTGGASAGGTGSGGVGTGGASAGGTGSGGVGTGGASAGGTGSGGVGAGGAGTGGAAGDPNAGQVRFVNVAPGAPALDVCMKLTSDSSYTAAPIFEGLGRTTGLAFGEISDYLDLGTTPSTYYDFIFVAASGTTCAPPTYGAIGSRLILASSPMTVAIYQYSFGVNAYNGAMVSDAGTPTATKANVRFLTATQTPATVDFHATPSAGAETIWFSSVPFQTGTAFHATDAGTYAFRITGGGSATTIAQKTGVVLSAASPLDVLFYPSDAASYGLMQCPSTQATLVSTCTP